MEFTPEIIKSYEVYKTKIPLDLEETSNIEKFENWKSNHQLNLLEFSRIVYFIVRNSNVNAFEYADFDFDMDNISPVLHALHEQKIISFQGLSSYSNNLFASQENPTLSIEENEIIENPNTLYNQFPCNAESRRKRLEIIISDHPFIESMNMGILGDDDLLSIEIQKIKFLNPIVFEIDPNVINRIKEKTSKDITIKEIDFTSTAIKKDEIILDSFIVDPPYNLNGLLCFIFNGVKRLRNFNDFYLVSNQMMLGKNDLLKAQQILSQSGIILKKIIPGFNKYPFPESYREYSDFQCSLNKINGDLDKKNSISSSSSLFIFNTSRLDINIVNSLYKKYSAIYQRYTG